MAAKKKSKRRAPPEAPNVLHDDGVHCVWPIPDWPTLGECGSLSGPSYLGRPLCDLHHRLAMGATTDGSYFPRQLVNELLQIPFSKEEEQMYKTMSFAEREAKVKGMECSGCSRNVPDANPKTVEKAWCWECVLTGRFRGEAPRARRAQVVEAADEGEMPEQQSSSSRGSGDRDVVKQMLLEASSGTTSYKWQGGKVTSVFTKGKSPKSVAVQDNKGITTYDLDDEVHHRIIFNRVLRWMKKGEPTTSKGVVALKGPKLPVKIGGTRGSE